MAPLVETASPGSSAEAHMTEESLVLGPTRFEAEGVGVSRKRRRKRWIPYAEVTHCARSRWGYAIATTRDVTLLRRSLFASEEEIGRVDRELRSRIAGLPGGLSQLEAMAKIEALSVRPGKTGIVYVFIALCLFAQLLEFWDPALVHGGSFIPSLVAQGETWRVLIANFLHDTLIFPAHILLNMVCVLSFGLLVERALGKTRTALVMGISALGAMWAAMVAGYVEVIGASGVAAGLVGSTLCLELNVSRLLPVWSRIPRRVFILALVGQGIVDLLVPLVAGAAHLGGFAFGYVATRSLIAGGRIPTAPSGLTRGLAGVIGLALVVSLALMAPLVLRDPVALEEHGIRVLRMPDPRVRYDNEAAWRMLTESEPTETGLDVALFLALRAARYSDWRDPNVLDTLAEALFASGDIGGSLEVIDQAIFLSHGHRYFVQQRQRFSGQRDPDDRPDPPEEGWFRQLPDALEDPAPGQPLIEPAEPGESAWI